MNSKIIAYALDFSSFLIQKSKYADKINNIILFGSAVRNEIKKNSDIDIFVDLFENREEIESEIRKCLEDFINSAKYKNYWKLLGVSNEISLTIGKLDEWKELKPAIISQGLVIYGKFKSEANNGEHKVFFVWENIKPNSKRVLFNKQLQGYKQNGKFYNGLIQKYDGERMGKGCILVPLEHSNNFNNLFKKYKISVKISKAIVY